jgi:tetratricopeptide (TPR) repeat protein
MIVSLMLAAALTSLPADKELTVTGSVERYDVAHDELQTNENQAAVEKILASDLFASRDPAALLNLGTAYARLGDHEKARHFYNAALTTRDRYQLELADGTWVDSRRAAHLARNMLAEGQVLALR